MGAIASGVSHPAAPDALTPGSAAPSAAAQVAAGRPVLVHSFDEWREAARELILHKVPPHAVAWISQHDGGDLLAGLADAPAPACQGDQALQAVAPAPPMRLKAPSLVRIPRQMMEMLQSAACYRAPNRWA